MTDKVMDDRAHARFRPAMYVGNNAGWGRADAVYQLVLGGYAASLERRTRVTVMIHADGSITVEDNGPGLSGEGENSPLAAAFTTYAHPGFACHPARLGPTLTAYVSSWTEVSSRCEGQCWTMELREGLIVSGPTAAGPAKRSGLRVRTMLDPAVFVDDPIDFDRLVLHCRALAVCSPGLTIVLEDKRHGKRVKLSYRRGVEERLSEVGRGHDSISLRGEGELDGGLVRWRAALGMRMWYEPDAPTDELYVNGCFLASGGSALQGLRRGVTEAALRLVLRGKTDPDERIRLAAAVGDSVARRLRVVVALEHPNPPISYPYLHGSPEWVEFFRRVALDRTPKKTGGAYGDGFWGSLRELLR